jgi:hypothetical protein
MSRLLAALALLCPSLAAADHAVFDLGDNRLLAHVTRGGGTLAVAGSAGFAKYLGGGRPNLPWQLGQTVDGHRVAVATDTYVRLTLPLAAPAKTLTARLSAPKARALEVQVAGTKGGQAPMAAGWQTVRVPVDVGPGEVELTLAVGKGTAVEWVQLGGDAPDAVPPLYDHGALVLPQGGGLAYYVQIPTSGKLAADTVGCDVAVRAKGQSGPTVEGVLSGAGATVDLAALAGHVVRLDLQARGCPEARLKNAALTAPGPAPAVARPSQPKNIVFWTWTPCAPTACARSSPARARRCPSGRSWPRTRRSSSTPTCRATSRAPRTRRSGPRSTPPTTR